MSLSLQTCLHWEYGEAESRVLSFTKQAGPQVFKVEGSGSPARETSVLVFLRQRLVTETGVLVWRRGVQRTTRHRFYGYHTSQRKSQDHTTHTPSCKENQRPKCSFIRNQFSRLFGLGWKCSFGLCKIQLGFPPPGLSTYSIRWTTG